MEPQSMDDSSGRDIKKRQEYVTKAKESESFLDSVFYIYFYNHDVKRWGAGPKPADITPDEIFPHYQEAYYQRALDKVRSLNAKTGYVGLAFYESGSMEDEYQVAVSRMKKEYPGFNNTVYGIVADTSIRDMR
jgi:hypothetical protein